MARQLRVEYRGAIYHVTVRGNGREDLFLDDQDRRYFLSCLSESGDACGVRLYLFCLMPNHFHLVVETPNGNLSRFMQKALTGYTVYFNLRHRRHGHVTQGRYGARLAEGDEYLLKLSRYVHLNPVKVKSAEKLSLKEKIRYLREYPWSSYRVYIGTSRRPEFVETGPMLSLVGGSSRDRGERYRRYVEEGMVREDEVFQIEIKRSPRSIGSERFREWVDSRYEENATKRNRREDVSFRGRLGGTVSAEEILRVIGTEVGMEAEMLKDRRRDWRVKGVAAHILCKHGGLTQRECAGQLGLGTGAAVSYQIRKLMNDLDRKDSRLRRMVDRIEKRLTRRLRA